MNISIINRVDDALRYIKPETQAEQVLYELLDEVERLKDYIDNAD